MKAPPDSVLRDIANATGVDDRRFVQMELSVRCAIEVATEMWRAKQIDFRRAPGKPLVEVMQAARELRQKLKALDAGARQVLAVCLEVEDQEGDGLRIQDYKQLIDDLAQAAEDAVDLYDWNMSRRRSRVGRPPGPRNRPLHFLVMRLRTAIEFEAGGRLSYERKTEGGTLVSVLELLRPHLDEGLIPEPLPWRALEEITSRKTPK